MTKLRCAIYTRKSSEEGLEQDFNSLDAQREACLAYITSQKGEGWTALPARYDDGGWSGGNMERPGLQQLLRDIEAGRVDIVVVYKVDRLTRSLSDFARIVETFDGNEVSFVSVTQAFNTTSSMGRLTLNVLLSFAQFEREVTGERIRDKIAASKARGMWMGGSPPLGYVPHNRALLIDQQEAELVRSIFRRYLEIGSVHVLARQLSAEGVRSRSWTTSKGEPRGNAILSRGKLFHLLRNRIYVGEIIHRDKVYPGLHKAILDRETFDAVQSMLERNIRRRKTEAAESAPLIGLLFDAAGYRMSPVHSRGRSGKRYRYYNSTPLQSGHSINASSRRIPAEPIEELVLDRFRAWSGEPNAGWERFVPLMKRIDVHPQAVIVTFVPRDNTRWSEKIAKRDEVVATADGMLRVTIASAVRTRGGRSSMMTDTANRPRPDRTLIAALRSAHRILGEHGIDVLSRTPGLDEARGIDDPWSRKIVRLAFLAPDLQHAIMIGRQRSGLTVADLTSGDFPLDWVAQRAAIGG